MIIFFNKKIYSQSAIKQAIKNYRQLANFSLNQKKNYFFVKINKICPEIGRTIGDEFSNHVLSLTKR